MKIQTKESHEDWGWAKKKQNKCKKRRNNTLRSVGAHFHIVRLHHTKLNSWTFSECFLMLIPSWIWRVNSTDQALIPYLKVWKFEKGVNPDRWHAGTGCACTVWRTRAERFDWLYWLRRSFDKNHPFGKRGSCVVSKRPCQVVCIFTNDCRPLARLEGCNPLLACVGDSQVQGEGLEPCHMVLSPEVLWFSKRNPYQIAIYMCFIYWYWCEIVLPKPCFSYKSLWYLGRKILNTLPKTKSIPWKGRLLNRTYLLQWQLFAGHFRCFFFQVCYYSPRDTIGGQNPAQPVILRPCDYWQMTYYINWLAGFLQSRVSWKIIWFSHHRASGNPGALCREVVCHRDAVLQAPNRGEPFRVYGKLVYFMICVGVKSGRFVCFLR